MHWKKPRRRQNTESVEGVLGVGISHWCFSLTFSVCYKICICVDILQICPLVNENRAKYREENFKVTPASPVRSLPPAFRWIALVMCGLNSEDASFPRPLVQFLTVCPRQHFHRITVLPTVGAPAESHKSASFSVALSRNLIKETLSPSQLVLAPN